MSSRVRGWCFTINNYTDEHRDRIATFVPEHAEYLCYQPERGANAGTTHLQGYVSFKHPRTLAGVRRLFNPINPHFEPRRGTEAQAIAYCRKADTADPDAGFGFTSFGPEPNGVGQGTRSDLVEIGRRLREGEALREVASDYPGDFIRYHRGLIAYQNIFAPIRLTKSRVYWFYGTTGTGKSHAARARFPDAFWKSADNTWWDGYDGRKDVVIDDYRTSFCKFSYLLNLFDEYPLIVQIKGGTVQFAAKNIVVTAPYHPRRMWASRTDEALQQLLRRIEVVELFGEEPPEIDPRVEGFEPGA
jgi:hypothetical protein